MNTPAPVQTPEGEWEKRFEDAFCNDTNREFGWNVQDMDGARQVKDFIRQELSAARQRFATEAIEAVEAQRDRMKYPISTQSGDDKAGIATLEETLKIIRNKI